MNCEFELCIYNEKNKCVLEKIDINELGMCDNCILVNISNKILAKEKTSQLNRIIAKNSK